MKHEHTTFKQSEELTALGLSPLTADLVYEKQSPDDEPQTPSFGTVAIDNNLFSHRFGFTTPCWSLGALMNLIYGIDHESFELHVDGIEKRMTISWLDADEYMCCEYKVNYKNLLTAAFEIVKWILKNKKDWLPTESENF